MSNLFPFYAKFFSRSHDAVIPVYDDAGNVIETHEHKAKFEARSRLPRADALQRYWLSEIVHTVRVTVLSSTAAKNDLF